MSVKGIEGLSDTEIGLALDRGAKFVVFEYTISIFIMTFKRSSDIHFVHAGEGTFFKSLPYTLVTVVAGWWGIPWGPIYSIGSLYTNLTGGNDVTNDLLEEPEDDY